MPSMLNLGGGATSSISRLAVATDSSDLRRTRIFAPRNTERRLLCKRSPLGAFLWRLLGVMILKLGSWWPRKQVFGV